MNGLRRAADLLIFVGPSGCGKSSIIQRIVRDRPTQFGFSVSHTTRAMRTGEKDGEHYHFVSESVFQRMVEQNEFAEHASVHVSRYGTSFAALQKVLNENKMVVMDTDVSGALNLRQSPTLTSVIVFVVPPSPEELQRRLRDRGTESEEAIQKRLRDSFEWMRWYDENSAKFDFRLVNEHLDQCLVEFDKRIYPACFKSGPCTPLSFWRDGLPAGASASLLAQGPAGVRGAPLAYSPHSALSPPPSVPRLKWAM